jgi:hypothetical protein
MTDQEALIELNRFRNEPYSKLHPYFTEAVTRAILALIDKIQLQRKVS